MECTQRIECTQDLSQNTQERIFPEEIGFLGICGKRYPIRKGPNKIGRDPGFCEIVLNLNSVSRQHAVINILNSKDYMIMDLGSANKTKLLEKTLQPYIPHKLRNGDTVQFGQIFGVFRLFEDENDLPMTQVLDIPDTPVLNKHASKLNNLPSTVIPESPDVSDKDDSFVVPSQPKNYVFKSPSQNYIKSFGKTIAIQPIGSKQIDNIYWSSSKKSADINLDESDVSLKNTEVDDNIHEMETQMPFPQNDNDPDDLYSANTQLCENLSSNKVILKTNIEKNTSPDKQLEIHGENKENNNGIHNADTQNVIITEKEEMSRKNSTGNASLDGKDTSKDNHNVSEEVIHFEDVDMEPLDEDFASQPLLHSKTINSTENSPILNGEKSTDDINKEMNFVDDDNKSEGSTDCEDMVLTQKIPYLKPDTSPSGEIIKPNISSKNVDTDDDITDCEDDLFENEKVNVSNKVTGPSNTATLKVIEIKTNSTTQNANKISENNNSKDQISDDMNFEDMLTQVVEVVNHENNDNLKNANDSSFEDLPTQVITVTTSEQVFKPIVVKEEKSPFKIPFKSVKSIKRKEVANNSLNTSIKKKSHVCDDDENNFYAATQDIFNDLCTQREISTKNMSSNIDSGNARLPNRGTDMKGDKPQKHQIVDMDIDNELRLTKQNSAGSVSSSDVESTPDNSQRNTTFMITEPPDSQEIVKSITFNTKPLVMESFSDSEDNMSEQNTPILFHKRKRIKNTKLDLTKKFELESLPSRTITRTRKPTAKVENSEIKDAFKNILAPKIFGDQDEGVDKEIIAANISRIKNTKNKEEKKKSNHNDTTKPDQTKQNQILKKVDKTEISVDKNDKSPENSKNQNSKKSRTETKPSINEDKKSKPKNKNNNLDSTKHDQIPETSKTDTSRPKSTRNKPKNDKNKPTKEIIKVAIIKPKGKRTYEEEIEDESPEKEVRRSKRQKMKKEQEIERSNTKKTRSNKIQNETSKYDREKSIIYRLSDESAASSPRSGKSMKDTTENNSEVTSSTERRSLRRTAMKNTKHKVLFTAFSCTDTSILYNLLEKLNAVIVSDVSACTVVVTVELKRTFKLLCAVGLGKPIVGTTWIQACRDTNMIVDPWQYLLQDEGREARFHFSLSRTLTGKRNFLKGYNVSSTPKVEPKPNEMKFIVECSGGTWKEGGSPWVCISTAEDRAQWPALRRRGAIVVNAEFILGGVLRQKIDLERNILK